MPVAQTSKEAYTLIQDELGERQLTVLNALAYLKTANNNQLSHYLGLPINCITGRIKELRDKWLVEFRYEKEDVLTGKKTNVWGLSNAGYRFLEKCREEMYQGGKK